MSLNVDQVRALIARNQNQPDELQSLLAMLKQLSDHDAILQTDFAPVVREVTSRFREVTGMRVAEPSFLNFMGGVPFTPNARFLSLLDELEKRGVVWKTTLGQPPFRALSDLVRDQRVLAFGSLEGNLEWTLARAGATRVLGVEGYIENYRKCLVLKALYPDLAFDFLHADVQQLEVEPDFDIIVCPGVLYHLHQPHKLLLKMRDLKPRYIFISTQVAVDPPHSAFDHYGLGETAEIPLGDEVYRGRWWSDSRKNDQDYFCGLDGRPSFWFYPAELRRLLQDLGLVVLSWDLVDQNELGQIAQLALSLPAKEGPSA